jgi:hypothetical protein
MKKSSIDFFYIDIEEIYNCTGILSTKVFSNISLKLITRRFRRELEKSFQIALVSISPFIVNKIKMIFSV